MINTKFFRRSRADVSPHAATSISLKLNFEQLRGAAEQSRDGGPAPRRTDVPLGHAALLRRSPSLCCPHSRHLHSLHCCLKSFKSGSLSLCLLLKLQLPCCLEMKRTKKGDNGGRGRGGGGVLPEEDERGERSEGRRGRRGNDRVCLGYFGFLWLLCGASVLSLLPESKLKEQGCSWKCETKMCGLDNVGTGYCRQALLCSLSRCVVK